MAVLAGFLLALAVVFAALIWVVMSFAHLEAHSLRAVTYVVGLALAGVLSVGLGWSKVRQKLTGQVDNRIAPGCWLDGSGNETTDAAPFPLSDSCQSTGGDDLARIG